MSQSYARSAEIRQEGTSALVTYHEVSGGLAGGESRCKLDQTAPVRQLVDMIGDKWSLLCLYALDSGPVRFNALERQLDGISQKVLAQTLRKLERAGLITRRAFAEVPPRVEYELSARGCTLKPLLLAMCEWSRSPASASTSTPAEQ